MKFKWYVSGILIVLLSSCAQQDSAKPRQPLNEAYRLMDKGENAKAIYLLENYLKNTPIDREAKLLTASAYMGEAGVDIYHSFDSFKDILFSLPLGEWLVRRPSNLPQKVLVGGAPLEMLIGYMDLILGKTKHIVSFLSRFPAVKPKSWPLLDRALEHMEFEDLGLLPSNDERLYRTFIRIVYLKAVLDEKVLSDESFGSLKWACNLELLSLRENIVWATRNLYSVTNDFKAVFPKREGELLVLHEALHTALELFDHKSPAGTKTAIIGFESALKDQLKCNLQAK